MAGATWDSIFAGNKRQVRKGLYGSVLVQDYLGTTDYTAYTPFDPTTGLLSATLLTTDLWKDIGYCDETGVSFAPTYTTVSTTSWQTRQDLRTDATVDTETGDCVALQDSPIVQALYKNVPIAGQPAIGASGYQMIKPVQPQVVYRTVMFLGVDGSSGTGANGYIFMAKIYPCALQIKPGKQDYAAKTELQFPLSFQAYPDPASKNTSVIELREGPGWRALTA
ncbi:MAG: hypothetical protein ACRDRN_26475 [Sciscionella sp.]